MEITELNSEVRSLKDQLSDKEINLQKLKQEIKDLQSVVSCQDERLGELDNELSEEFIAMLDCLDFNVPEEQEMQGRNQELWWDDQFDLKYVEEVERFKEENICLCQGVSEENMLAYTKAIQLNSTDDREAPAPVIVCALCGWLYSESQVDILQCNICCRKIGLWNYKFDNTNENPDQLQTTPKKDTLAPTEDTRKNGNTLQNKTNDSDSGIHKEDSENEKDSENTEHINGDSTENTEVVDTGTKDKVNGDSTKDECDEPARKRPRLDRIPRLECSKCYGQTQQVKEITKPPIGKSNYYVSPTECFLRYLTYPEDASLAVDLHMSAVVVMSHLDRLCQPYLPLTASQKDSNKENTVDSTDGRSFLIQLKNDSVQMEAHSDEIYIVRKLQLQSTETKAGSDEVTRLYTKNN